MSSQSPTSPETPASPPGEGPGAAVAAHPSPPRLDADGRERPRFVLAFPNDPQLEELVHAFEAGDFARVRNEAPRLAASTQDSAVRDAALELRRRINPDPSVVLLLALSFALLGFVALWAYL